QDISHCANLPAGCDSPGLSDSGGGRIMVPEGGPNDGKNKQDNHPSARNTMASSRSAVSSIILLSPWIAAQACSSASAANSGQRSPRRQPPAVIKLVTAWF